MRRFQALLSKNDKYFIISTEIFHCLRVTPNVSPKIVLGPFNERLVFVDTSLLKGV